ncbi:MAG TPA: hypothetical protein VL863_02920 [bacterium]|nr:hypothetical protein [bacterium]
MPSVLPAAMVFSQNLLTRQDSPVSTTNPGLPDENEEKLILRATRVTTVLRNIQGYDHYGIND